MNYIIAFLIGVGLCIWVTESRREAEEYSETHHEEISTWEAMFLNYNERERR
jgi:hypothetical protein